MAKSNGSTPNPNPLSDWSNFDENNYYMQSTDEKGHFKSVQVAVPPDLYAMAMLLVSSPDHPYRSFQDVVRDALIHVLELRSRVIPNPAHHFQVIKYQNEEARRQRMEQGKLDSLLVSNIGLAIKTAISGGDTNFLQKEIAAAEEMVDGLPPNLRHKLSDMIVDARNELAILEKQVERYLSQSKRGNGSTN